MTLAPLLDSVFLSTRNSLAVYTVERDGRIWKSPYSPRTRFHENRIENVIGNWQELIPVQECEFWRWKSGYLPVLEIGGNGHVLELMAYGDELFARMDEQAAWNVQSGEQITSDNFSMFVKNITVNWENFFATAMETVQFDDFSPNIWKSCFVQSLSAFYQLHPKYGTGYYYNAFHDGFPPTVLAMAHALLDYGKDEEALNIFSYYLNRFILPDGSIDYYGPSISEYGMLLVLADRAGQASNGPGFLAQNRTSLINIVRFLLRLRDPIRMHTNEELRLMHGIPEADMRDAQAVYLHNNAWAWRGLLAFSHIAEKLHYVEWSQTVAAEAIDLYNSLRKALFAMPHFSILPFRLDKSEKFNDFSLNRETSYANQRYYPELLESNFPTHEEALQLIRAREQYNGECHGMTLFHMRAAFDLSGAPEYCCNNWPIAAYGTALARLGEWTRLKTLIHSHVKFHQTPDTYTSYESVSADSPIRNAVTDFCVPSQLVYPRLLAIWNKATEKAL